MTIRVSVMKERYGRHRGSKGAASWNGDKVCVWSWVPERWKKKEKVGQLQCWQHPPPPGSCTTRCDTWKHQARCHTLETCLLHPTSNLNWRRSSCVTVSVWEVGESWNKTNTSCLLLAGHHITCCNDRQEPGHHVAPTCLHVPISTISNGRLPGILAYQHNVLCIEVENSCCHLQRQCVTLFAQWKDLNMSSKSTSQPSRFSV